jgi:hypothetical protein
MVCRFHDINRGHCHAHLHVLPASFDLIGRTGHDLKWKGRPTTADVTANERYLFQEIGDIPEQTWAVGSLPIWRHFVRTAFQDLLAESGQSWIPLSATPDDHDENVERTALLFRNAPKEKQANAILLYGGSVTLLRDVSLAIHDRRGWPIIDQELLYRFVTWLDRDVNRGQSWSVVDYFKRETAKYIMPSAEQEPLVYYNGKSINDELFDSNLEDNFVSLIGRNHIHQEAAALINFLSAPSPAIVIGYEALADEGSDEFMRAFLTVPDSSPSLNHPATKLSPTWQDVRLETDELNVTEISDLILSAFDLRTTQ